MTRMPPRPSSSQLDSLIVFRGVYRLSDDIVINLFGRLRFSWFRFRRLR